MGFDYAGADRTAAVGAGDFRLLEGPFTLEADVLGSEFYSEVVN